MTTTESVAKLWNLCHILRDDGITYHQYLTELTYLLFLKMMKERGPDIEKQLPEGLRWRDLCEKTGEEQLTFYKMLLGALANHQSPEIRAIYSDAKTNIARPRNLTALTDAIDKLSWHASDSEELGNLYEGLLEKNAEEKKAGAGQYFTPRPLIDSMVALMKPRPGEIIEDPAAGTGGFLIAAHKWLNDHYKPKKGAQRTRYVGMELVADTHRLGLMNLMLHDMDGDFIHGDTLSDDGEQLPAADLILTNPPFGTKKGGGEPTRKFPFPTANKQLSFLQQIYYGLKPGGRAAVVLPDNVLFEGNIGRDVRRDLMERCDLHTILRLPTGIFYAQGVNTNVLFFTRGKTSTANTKEIWVYDLRTEMPSFGKTTPLERKNFSDFEAAFGNDPLGHASSRKQVKDERFRRYSREEISDRDDRLDLTWLRSRISEKPLPKPEVIAKSITSNLEAALARMRSLAEELSLSDSGEAQE